MKKNKKNIIVFLGLIFVMTFSFIAFSNNAMAAGGDSGGLVPCGSGSNKDDRCELCDLIVGIKNIIDWGQKILVAIALTAITAGGIMYIISAGDEQMMQTAKGVIKQAVIGVIIVLSAWLIVNTSMWLLATKGIDDEGGKLGIKVLSWNEFVCDGDVGAYYEDNDASN